MMLYTVTVAATCDLEDRVTRMEALLAQQLAAATPTQLQPAAATPI